MALGGEAMRRPFPAAIGDVEVSGGAAPVFLAADKDRPVDPLIWGDEERMKRELLAWAKAVASMAISKNASSPSSSPSTRRSE
ncbi:hypothetical protein PR202_gb17459 [Eleusine coracana subsp. coracana]|uniref:Uncharacterized protein n=1 Tax=Eleusine coracana subsp. coracana TaxID=191504 RepID=A0AAV5F2H0_ELECO|nr:hypothetical protein QOZ80_6BG0465970 [Eleusine coracana subsp. coracana]GJN29252.1 hypothetical protein PR202_gb17459 [Eleusine coracana subsp. coracana]